MSLFRNLAKWHPAHISLRQKADEAVQAPKKIPTNKSFVLNTFRSKIVLDQVFPYKATLTGQQKDMINTLREPVHLFFKEVNDSQSNDTNEAVPRPVLKSLWDMGLLGLQVPPNLGGLGLNNSQYAQMLQIVGQYDLGIAVMIGAHQGLALKGLSLFGSPEQKEKYLTRLSSGELASFCLGESFLGAEQLITIHARLTEDKTHYILNGSKDCVTNATDSSVMVVLAAVPAIEEGSKKPVDKISAFIVEKGYEGVVVGASEKKLGTKCCTSAPISFQNVHVPVQNLLGPLGDGLKIAMSILNSSRLGMSAALCGAMTNCISKAALYVKHNSRIGKAISALEIAQAKLSSMAMLQYISESMAYTISYNMDDSPDNQFVEAAIAKCFSSEAAWLICDEAIQIMGGRGYLKAAGLEKILRDLRLFRLLEKTNETLRLTVAMRGIHHAKAEDRELSRIIEQRIQAMGINLDVINKHVPENTQADNIPVIAKFVHNDLKMSSVLLGNCVKRFGDGVQHAIKKHQAAIVERELILSTIADAAMYIYTMAVALSRASYSISQNLPSAQYESLLTQCWCVEANHRVHSDLDFIKHQRLNLKKYGLITKMLCESGGACQASPVVLEFADTK